MTKLSPLSHAEQEAMDRLKGTCIPIDSVHLKNEKDFVYGTVIPGLNVYKKLEKEGLRLK